MLEHTIFDQFPCVCNMHLMSFLYLIAIVSFPLSISHLIHAVEVMCDSIRRKMCLMELITNKEIKEIRREEI